MATGVGLGHKECCDCYRGTLRPPDSISYAMVNVAVS